MLGCRRNVSTIHTIENMAAYAEAAIQGNPLSPDSFYEGDDLQIMAGDFLVNNEGQLLFTHPTKFPQDRPSVEQILTVLSKLK